ncbi:DASH family cryptochrome [Lacihabitans lacunae]|uniref:Cryptochrome DASH n=1 Tax=Lacihabitans lacunae TaxID=1028214 RepID=A0ABV7YSZ2_9BACT
MKKVLFWFRNDLRLHDNEALIKAAELGDVIPVYIIDERQFENTSFGFKRTEKFRAKFLLETLQDLKSSLQSIGSDLIVKVGIPELELILIANKYEVDHVVASKEVTQEETSIESLFSYSLKPLNIDIDLFWGNTLIHVRDLPFQIHFLPDIFTDFRKRIEGQWKVRPLYETPKSLGTMPDIKVGPIPTLADLGFEEFEIDPRDDNQFVGGEQNGFKRLNAYIWESNLIATYKETRNGMIGKDYSSKLSPWLSLGALSPRTVYYEVKKYEEKNGANDSTYWLIFELLWRDYFHFIALKFGIRLFKRCGIKHDFTKKWRRNKDHFKRWIDGKTGVPIVDAAMQELKQTGYLSNRGRQIAASYFSKDMAIEWWWGAMYFESYLIDYEVCSNWGNWNYIAGIGTDPREDRYFNPVNQARKYDPEAAYMKLWLPELSQIDNENLIEFMTLGDSLSEDLDYPKMPISKPKRV